MPKHLDTRASALDHHPELRALVDLAISLAQARDLVQAAKREVEEAQAIALQAKANAHRALETQLFVTVAEYVFLHQLEAQLPKQAYKACSTYLRRYSLDHGIPFRKSASAGSQQALDPYAFHQSVYAEAFEAWLQHRPAQPPLAILPRVKAKASQDGVK
jgi:hypothetical protein